MGWFFKKNANSEESKKPAWVDVSILNPIDYFFALFLVMIFIGLFYFLLMVLPVLPLLTVIWCVYSSIFYKGEMLGNKVSALGVIGQMFKYYKFSFMTIISFFVIVVAFNTLGVIPGAFCVLVTVLKSLKLYPEITSSIPLMGLNTRCVEPALGPGLSSCAKYKRKMLFN
jgi:hypothetical protein